MRGEAGKKMMRLLTFALLTALSEATEFPGEQKCPEECDCHYFRVNYVTDCSDSNLTEIPYGQLSPNVYVLDMSGNKISEVQTFPEDTKVRRLQLAENDLTEVTANMFSGLKYVVEVDLSGNQITKVDPNAFRDSHGLITITLRKNPLMNVESGPFLKCISLLHLDLSDSGLSRLSDDFFTEMPHLTHLDLSGNPLGSLQPIAFRPLLALSELLINDCNLTNLNPDLLERQTQLKLLELTGNELTTVDWTPIVGRLPRLETLNLRRTWLRNLPGNVFTNNTFLRILVLGDNELTDLDIKTTLGENLKNLHSLDLSNCNLSGPLDETSFLNATALRVLNLSGNRLSSRDLSIALSPLVKLTTLSLRDCSLTKLPRDTFENLSQLKELDISWNPLNNVFEDLLHSLTNLEYLNMGYSNLSQLSKDTFSKTTNLKKLILSGNKLGDLETGLFNNLEYLETLEIVNCNLEKGIDGDLFLNRTYGDLRELKMAGNPLRIEEGPLLPEQMSGLKLLDLSNCNISYLPNESFNNTPNLTRLSLKNNQLTTDFMLNATFLSVLSNLEYLDLSGNRLTKLPTDVVQASKLQDVKLTNNPWICDCSLGDWWSWALRRGDLTHLIGSTITVDDPATRTNKRNKKGLFCRVDASVTPPLKKRQGTTATETGARTWARYLKESECSVEGFARKKSGNLTAISGPIPDLLPSPEPKVDEHPDEPERSSKNLYVIGVFFGLSSLVACFAVGYLLYSRRRRDQATQDSFELHVS